jgi:hypothetical protein
LAAYVLPHTHTRPEPPVGKRDETGDILVETANVKAGNVLRVQPSATGTGPQKGTQ